jgi:hypothetical protein
VLVTQLNVKEACSLALTPDWFDKPHEEWPDAAKEFYRLLFIGQRRANEKKLRAQGGPQPAGQETPRSEP